MFYKYRKWIFILLIWFWKKIVKFRNMGIYYFLSFIAKDIADCCTYAVSRDGAQCNCFVARCARVYFACTTTKNRPISTTKRCSLLRVVYPRRHPEKPDWFRRNRSCRESLASLRENHDGITRFIQRVAFSTETGFSLLVYLPRNADDCHQPTVWLKIHESKCQSWWSHRDAATKFRLI